MSNHEAPAPGEYTRKGLLMREWNSIPADKVALRLPRGRGFLVVPRSIADEVEYVSPFGTNENL